MLLIPNSDLGRQISQNTCYIAHTKKWSMPLLWTKKQTKVFAPLSFSCTWAWADALSNLCHTRRCACSYADDTPISNVEMISRFLVAIRPVIQKFFSQTHTHTHMYQINVYSIYLFYSLRFSHRSHNNKHSAIVCTLCMCANVILFFSTSSLNATKL